MISPHAIWYRHIERYVRSRWFVAIFMLKLAASFLFATDVLAKGFVPFVDYFVRSGFQNPYTHFLALDLLKAFPYSTVMLWILAIPRTIFAPLFSGFGEVITPLHLFMVRMPLLLADIVIYLVLCAWLPARSKKVLLLYWASPLLFYINYFHGQLDIIPTAILVVSLAMLFARREWLAHMMLGVGIAAKAHLFAALPFYFLYAYVRHVPWRRMCLHIGSAVAVYLVLLVPYISSPGYQQLVLKAEEQGWVFLLNFPYVGKPVALLLAPAVYLVLFFRFASYRKLTQDLFLVMLGLVFSTLVIFVPPMPGWFYWSLPFLIYFYIKKPEAPTLSLWLLNAFFLAYFLFNSTSDLFRSFQIIAPSIAALPTPYAFIAARGVNAQLITDILFTALQVSLAMNVLWCYKVGVRDSLAYREKTKPLLLGIGGDSGAGKTTLSEVLTKLFHSKNVVCVRGDDAHRWPRGDRNWQVFTHLDPKGNRLHKDLQAAIALKAGHPIERVTYDHNTGTFTDPVQIAPNNVVLFEGLHPYYLKQIRDLFDIKLFVDPVEELRVHWKLIRDVVERGASREAVISQLDSRREDADKFVRPQKELADIVVRYELAKPISQPGSPEEEIMLRLKLTFDNSLDVEPLTGMLAETGVMNLEYVYDDLNTVSLICEGSVEAEEIERIAYRLIPNLRELTDTAPSFEKGLMGVIQLFVLYYLSEMSKLKEYRHDYASAR